MRHARLFALLGVAAAVLSSHAAADTPDRAPAARAPAPLAASTAAAVSAAPAHAVSAASAHAVSAATAPAVPAAPAPELTIWLYAPTALDDGAWRAWYDALALHRANVTGVAPCSYLVSSTGAFITQMSNASTQALAFAWTRRFAAELGLRTRPLIAASGSGMNLLIAPGNAANASAFIAQTVAELVALGASGFNLQLEEPGSAAIEADWKAFLGAWADALAAVGADIAVIIGGICRARDWMWMDCGDYRLLQLAHPNLRVIAEASYTKEPSEWKSDVANIVRGLGNATAQLGLEYGPPLLNHLNGCLPYARSLGVTSLWVWVDPPAGAANASQAQWDAFGWWVGGGA